VGAWSGGGNAYTRIGEGEPHEGCEMNGVMQARVYIYVTAKGVSV